jgi:hypothetical protein
MPSLRTGLLHVSLLLACACGRTEALPPRSSGGDAAPIDRDGGLDAGHAAGGKSDAGASECEGGNEWRTVSRRIASAKLLGPGPARMGTSDRVVVQVELEGLCERVRDVTVRVIPGGATDFVALGARAWVREGPGCARETRREPWIISVPGRTHGNLRVVVADENAPGGGLRLEYSRDDPGGAAWQCHAGAPIGTAAELKPCVTDCTCKPGLTCVAYSRGGVAGWECRRPCVTADGCGPDEQCAANLGDGLLNVCRSVVQSCQADSECRPGFTCERSWSRCVDERTLASDECLCDVQCAPGAFCMDLNDGHGPVCALPCERDEGCPGLGVCGTAGVCG